MKKKEPVNSIVHNSIVNFPKESSNKSHGSKTQERRTIYGSKIDLNQKRRYFINTADSEIQTLKNSRKLTLKNNYTQQGEKNAIRKDNEILWSYNIYLHQNLFQSYQTPIEVYNLYNVAYVLRLQTNKILKRMPKYH